LFIEGDDVKGASSAISEFMKMKMLLKEDKLFVTKMKKALQSADLPINYKTFAELICAYDSMPKNKKIAKDGFMDTAKMVMHKPLHNQNFYDLVSTIPYKLYPSPENLGNMKNMKKQYERFITCLNKNIKLLDVNPFIYDLEGVKMLDSIVRCTELDINIRLAIFKNWVSLLFSQNNIKSKRYGLGLLLYLCNIKGCYDPEFSIFNNYYIVNFDIKLKPIKNEKKKYRNSKCKCTLQNYTSFRMWCLYSWYQRWY